MLVVRSPLSSSMTLVVVVVVSQRARVLAMG